MSSCDKTSNYLDSRTKSQLCFQGTTRLSSGYTEHIEETILCHFQMFSSAPFHLSPSFWSGHDFITVWCMIFEEPWKVKPSALPFKKTNILHQISAISYVCYYFPCWSYTVQLRTSGPSWFLVNMQLVHFCLTKDGI